MYFSYIHSVFHCSPIPPRSILSPFQPYGMSFCIIFLSLPNPICVAHPLEHAYLGPHPYQKTDFLSPRSNQYLLSSSVHEPLPPACSMCPDLILCRDPQLCEFTSTTILSCPEDSFSLVFPSLWLLQSFHPLFCDGA